MKENLNNKIIAILEKSERPISTREIAIKANSSWHPVLTRCLRLQLEKKVDGFKAGNMYLWMLNKR